jgi:uncharacterized SAM-binding protein YcdF (DUF218 family)
MQAEESREAGESSFLRSCIPRRSARSQRAGVTFVLLICAGCGIPGRELFLPVLPRLERADAIVVLGNRPPVDDEGRVMPETERRIRHGVALFHADAAPVLIVTGGADARGIVEADVMAQIARELGVPRAAIVRERRARDTVENARYSVALCPRRDRSRPCRVIVVSSPYHLRRATRLFECAGARVQWSATELPDDLGYRASFAALEYGVRLSYIFDDACARARPR